MFNFPRFIISLLFPLVIGMLSSYFTVQSIGTWYVTIKKPWFNPPSWIFAPVWTLLYILMGIAFYLVWNSQAIAKLKNQAMIIFLIQLGLNFIWSYLFFYKAQPGWALVDILLMWVAIFTTILFFGRVSSTAAWLLVPYICWVSFATVLNYSIWRLN
jgi:tryptophan-rich sensory protein